MNVRNGASKVFRKQITHIDMNDLITIQQP